MRWSDIDQGLIAVVQNKTNKKLWIPIYKELAALLAVLEERTRKSFAGKVVEMRRYHQPILASTRKKPWTRDGFKASWSEQLNQPIMSELRLRRLVFHGLRKSAVVFLLEAGCSDAETSVDYRAVARHGRALRQTRGAWANRAASRCSLTWRS